MTQRLSPGVQPQAYHTDSQPQETCDVGLSGAGQEEQEDHQEALQNVCNCMRHHRELGYMRDGREREGEREKV